MRYAKQIVLDSLDKRKTQIEAERQNHEDFLNPAPYDPIPTIERAIKGMEADIEGYRKMIEKAKSEQGEKAAEVVRAYIAKNRYAYANTYAVKVYEDAITTYESASRRDRNYGDKDRAKNRIAILDTQLEHLAIIREVFESNEGEDFSATELERFGYFKIIKF